MVAKKVQIAGLAVLGLAAVVVIALAFTDHSPASATRPTLTRPAKMSLPSAVTTKIRALAETVQTTSSTLRAADHNKQMGMGMGMGQLRELEDAIEQLENALEEIRQGLYEAFGEVFSTFDFIENEFRQASSEALIDIGGLVVHVNELTAEPIETPCPARKGECKSDVKFAKSRVEGFKVNKRGPSVEELQARFDAGEAVFLQLVADTEAHFDEVQYLFMQAEYAITNTFTGLFTLLGFVEGQVIYLELAPNGGLMDAMGGKKLVSFKSRDKVAKYDGPMVKQTAVDDLAADIALAALAIDEFIANVEAGFGEIETGIESVVYTVHETFGELYEQFEKLYIRIEALAYGSVFVGSLPEGPDDPAAHPAFAAWPGHSSIVTERSFDYGRSVTIQAAAIAGHVYTVWVMVNPTTNPDCFDAEALFYGGYGYADSSDYVVISIAESLDNPPPNTCPNGGDAFNSPDDVFIYIVKDHGPFDIENASEAEIDPCGLGESELVYAWSGCDAFVDSGDMCTVTASPYIFGCPDFYAGPAVAAP